MRRLAGIVRSIDVVGEAMAPALKNGDKALATRNVDQLNRGDIVGFRYPKDETKSFLKRVMGLPGERIESVAGKVSINGQLLSEAYVVAENQSNDTWGPLTVPDDEFFMMGDQSAKFLRFAILGHRAPRCHLGEGCRSLSRGTELKLRPTYASCPNPQRKKAGDFRRPSVCLCLWSRL